MIKRSLPKGLNQAKKKTTKKTVKKASGFMKNGQTKVSQSPTDGLKKLAEDEKEYGIDDLVSDSTEEEGSEDVSETCE
jgi:CO dehydrogenase/acetyl-CoA synthase gamma subunit (corrinoid Fe-S protein)